MIGNRCRLCAKMKVPKAVLPTPVIDPGTCPTCKTSKRHPGRAYCRPCERIYMRNWHRLQRAKRTQRHRMSGVDIDRIHKVWPKK